MEFSDLQKQMPILQEIDEVNEFDIYKYSSLHEDPYIKGIPVMFITTPRLNLSVDNMKRDTYFQSLYKAMPTLLSSLTSDSSCPAHTTSPFIKLLSNRFLSLQGKDIAAKTFEVGETCYGYKQLYSGPIVDSITADTLTVSYHDSKHLPVIKLHKAWLDYREHIGRGFFNPSKSTINQNEIDFCSTIYYFILDFDFETILYYSQYVGVQPISNPYSSLTTGVLDNSEIPDISIEYVYSNKDDLNEDILVDFNMVTKFPYSQLGSGIEGGGDKAKAFMPKYSQVRKLINTVKPTDVFTDEYNISRSNFSNAFIAITDTEEGPGSTAPKYKFKLLFADNIEDSVGSTTDKKGHTTVNGVSVINESKTTKTGSINN